MDLVFINTLTEITSIKEFLKLLKISDEIIVNTVEDVCLQSMINDEINLYVFDYKLDSSLICNLNATRDKFKSIRIYANNLTIARQYLSITTNIQIMPQPYNIMLLLWNHPAFSLSNLNNCEDADNINLKLSEITEDSAVIEINTEIDASNTLNLSMVRNNMIDTASIKFNNMVNMNKKPFKSKRKEFKENIEEIKENVNVDDGIKPRVVRSSNTTIFEQQKRINVPIINSTGTCNSNLSKLRLASSNVVNTLQQYLCKRLNMSESDIIKYELDFRNNSTALNVTTLDEFLFKKNIINELQYTDILSSFYNKKVLNSIQIQDRVIQYRDWSKSQCEQLKFVQLQPLSSESDKVVVISNSKPETEFIIRRKYLNATIYFTTDINIQKILKEV